RRSPTATQQFARRVGSVAVDVVVGPQRLCQRSLGTAPRDNNNSVSESLGVLHREMAKPAEALHGDQCTWRSISGTKRVEHSDTGAEKWRSSEHVNIVRDAGDSGGAHVHLFRVTAVNCGARLWLVLAVDEVAASTLITFVALPTEKADSNAVTDLV